MSHFTVLVIGENPEQQLQPFHEFECTGILDEHVIIEDVTEEYQKYYNKDDEFQGTFEKYLEQDEIYVTNIGDNDTDDRFKYTYAMYEGTDLTVKRRTNPNAKWDWYVLGGRWKNFFKIMGNGGRADTALKKYIDFKGMLSQAYLDASNHYKKIANYFPDNTIPVVTKTWREINEENPDASRDILRELYYDQYAFKILKSAKESAGEGSELNAWFDLEEYGMSEKDYAEKSSKAITTTFAVVKDGQWFQKGDMGWWACVSNAKDETVWEEEFNKLVESVNGDTLLSVYDCHI